MNIIVTGASQGIGLELVTQALEQGHDVIAVGRKPADSTGLQALKARGAHLQMAAADVTQIQAFDQIAQAASSWPCVDILINNAGIYREGEEMDDFLSSFQVNSVAPLFVTRALFSKLKMASHPKAIQITSLMGSIQDNTSGGSYAYRASKTALNMINKTLSIDEGWLTTAVVHPGWVKTRMGGSQAPTTPQESAEGIWKVIHKLTRKESGSFFDFEGEHLPW